ncbi:MAG: Lrp/AsnC family transcriptional regulator [Candidatus Methanoperedens sp.]|nr:Lrp/AsnC family transcriptional regulator [Candidatus Methanoperedens sp.]
MQSLWRGTEQMAKVEIDETDRKILREYLKDARLSYREVARRVRVAVGTVMARTKRLETEGVIKGYTAVLDHEKLGYDLTAVTEITVSKGKLVEMEKEIAKLPVACTVYDVTGITDALIIAKFRSREELSNFTKSLLAMPFVERTNTHIVLTTVKEDFRLPP